MHKQHLWTWVYQWLCQVVHRHQIGTWVYHSRSCISTIYEWGWPEPYIYTYIYTVYFLISKPKIPYVHHIYMVLANPIYESPVGLATSVGAHRMHWIVCMVASLLEITYTHHILRMCMYDLNDLSTLLKSFLFKCKPYALRNRTCSGRPCRFRVLTVLLWQSEWLAQGQLTQLLHGDAKVPGRKEIKRFSRGLRGAPGFSCTLPQQTALCGCTRQA